MITKRKWLAELTKWKKDWDELFHQDGQIPTDLQRDQMNKRASVLLRSIPSSMTEKKNEKD